MYNTLLTPSPPPPPHTHPCTYPHVYPQRGPAHAADVRGAQQQHRHRALPAGRRWVGGWVDRYAPSFVPLSVLRVLFVCVFVLVYE